MLIGFSVPVHSLGIIVNMTTKRKVRGNAVVQNTAGRKAQRSPDKFENTAEKLRKILERVDRLPTIDHRSEEEILGYDEFGVPR